MTAKCDNPEERLQQAVVQYLVLACSHVIWFHPPNGEVRSKPTGARLKKMGVLRGVPDLVFVLPGGASAFIELKAPGAYLRPEQKDFRDRALVLGSKFALCRTLEEVISVLDEWGVSKMRAQRLAVAGL